MTAATSARGTVPRETGGGASRILPVAGASVRPPGRVQVTSAQIGLSGRLGRDVGRPDLVTAGLRRLAGSHRGDLHESADRGPFGGVGHQHGGRPVDRVLARGATARTSTGREYHRVSPGQQHRDIPGRGRLQVADDSFGAGLAHIGDVGRVPDQPDGLVAALGEQALQQERDLPVPARDHYTHAASLAAGKSARRRRHAA